MGEKLGAWPPKLVIPNLRKSENTAFSVDKCRLSRKEWHSQMFFDTSTSGNLPKKEVFLLKRVIRSNGRFAYFCRKNSE